MRMRRAAFLVLVMLLLIGCGTSAPQTASATLTPAPVEAQSAEAVATQTIDVPSLQGIMIKAGIVSDMRVIPSNLEPETQFTEIITSYQAAVADDSQHLRWFIGAPGGTSYAWLTIDTLSSSPTELVTLQYPLEVIISPTEISPAVMNFVAPIYGGGGGQMNSFPVLNLQAGVYQLQPDTVEVTELQSGQMTGVLYELSFQCVQPGVYNVHINQDFTLNVNGVLSGQMLPYDILFACPLSATVWLFNPNTQQVVATQSWSYANGVYLQQQSR